MLFLLFALQPPGIRSGPWFGENDNNGRRELVEVEGGLRTTRRRSIRLVHFGVSLVWLAVGGDGSMKMDVLRCFKRLLSLQSSRLLLLLWTTPLDPQFVT
jgi:hypothetical protein